MPDMLSTATSGLLTHQRALTTTSHNIANVNTDGYSRQRVEVVTREPTLLGGSFIGNGVQLDSVARIYDQFLTQELRDTTSVHSGLEKFSQLVGHIDDLLADPRGGISPVLGEFFSSIQDVADDPSSSTARLAMIEMGQTLASRFAVLDNRLQELSVNTAREIVTVVDEINDLVVAIRDVNAALSDAGGVGRVTQQSSDLLDRRDLLLDQLAEKVDISVVEGEDNQISIFIGNGQTVLSEKVAFTISAQPSTADPTDNIIGYNGTISVSDIGAQLNGGELGGLLDFRRNILEPTRNSLGRTAIAIADGLNAQMRDGMDLNGDLGQDFFSYTGPRVNAFLGNTGSASVSAVVTDITALTIDNYELDFDGANWTITSDSGATASVANGFPATLVFEGLTFTIDGTGAVAGDRFNIKPTEAASGSLSVLIDDASKVAAALPVRTSTALSNLGSVEVTSNTITDVTNPDLLNTAVFTFDSPPGTFTANVDVVVGGVTIAAGSAVTYTNNMVVDANGWQVSLSGSPQAGDQITVESNAGGVGDNRNALNLANLQNTGILDGGVASFQEDYGRLVGFVGSTTLSSNIERDAQGALLIQAAERKSALSGVNLDEEAADLIRFQQAYEASARVIGTVQTLFDTLINAVR